MKTSRKFVFCMLFCIFAAFFNVLIIHASPFQAYITVDDLNFRDKPTTKNSDIIGVLMEGNVVTVLDENKVTGDGCSSGWYNISFNNTKGYVCSKYVTTERIEDKFLRPWNSPYKAIVGGAIFISNGYISKGQYTSYLKKYNVNPDSAYAVYNHQYQTNIAAPSSEAYASWRAYDKVGYMKQGSESFPFIFTIPVYNNMAESYKVEGVTGANLSTTDETDDAFELMIKDFPDSYKPYLRDLHKDHPNWTFKVLNTNLDFEASADIEKEVGAVQNEKMRYKDADGRYIVTEPGWYKPTAEATRYYMDPRNWLNETYIFMFEDLSFNEAVSESVIKQILKTKPILPEKDPIDNMTYSSIFMEAGRKANVNPSYLASLSILEIGTGNIGGDEFEYKGVTYRGLYNFYNIGAYSSEENPLKAGLVYAAGGACTICDLYEEPEPTQNPVVDPEPTPTEPEQPTEPTNPNPPTPTEPTEPEQPSEPEVKYGDINKLGVKVSGDKVYGFKLGTKISELQAKDNLLKFTKDGNNVNNDDIIKTGMVIDTGEKKYNVVVYGDLNGDGKIDIVDLATVRLYLLGNKKLDGAYKEAGKITGGDVDITSLAKIRLYLLGKASISQG